MRVSRLYLPEILETGRQIELDDDSAHYLRVVLRLKKSANITLFNGDSREFSSCVVEASRKRVLIAVGDCIERSVESFLNVTVGLAVSRGNRMDMAVQKVVELGGNSITPLLTERCVVQMKGEKKQQKLNHWQKIVQHASEQSGRTVIPEVNQICELFRWLDSQAGLKIFLDPYAELSLAQLQPENGKVTLLSGPEGGFSERERELAIKAGFFPVRLGRRILRAETASLAALAAVQMLWGDFASTD
jgi:16S rRNA (uracil1498-N3)-methyltransferase